jgi:WD40 repeat protein
MELGEMFGRYRIDGLLGTGGMGEVCRAYDTEHDRVVALKRLPAALADAEAAARFRRESRIAASLTGPHIVPVTDFGEIDGQLYLAMRVVEGTDLRRLLDAGPLDPARTVTLLTQVADALDTAHAAGVVHRDVKPSNILIDGSDTAFLADFGIAKSVAPDATRLTRTGAEIGTLDYLAPERLMHAGADHRADVYALACVLFECLTGKKPFPAEDAAGKLAAQLNDPPPAPSLYDWRIPRSVDLVVATGMDKDPARRYPSAGELMAAAGTALRQQSVTTPITTPEHAADPSQGRIMDAIVAVASRQPSRAAADECPYPGLRSFSATESGVFFGREHAITDVLVRLSRQSPASGPLLVVGASGTGKSSLVRAGVLPALAAAGTGRETWPQLVTTPGPDPIGTLAARLAPLAGADPGGLAGWLHTRPAEFGRLCAQIAHRQGRLVLVVDQFEEVFTTGDPRQVTAFATALANAWPALVILVVRADFVEQCLRLPALRPSLASPYPLGPLAPAELARVITEPARAVGLEIEDGLVDRLITDIGGAGYDPGSLPRLAHALRQTWQNRTGPILTLRSYQDTGGVDRAVALTTDAVYTGLSEVDREQLRTALLRMVTVLDNGVARRKASRAEIPEHILARLVEARLVTAEADGVQLSHDALLTAWPRLRDWIEADRQGLLLRQHLGQAVGAWQASDREPGELYRGARLAATLEWAADRTDITGPEQEFLRASRRAQQRNTRRLRTLVAGLAVFLVLALVAGVLAVVKWRDATRAASEAESQQLAAGSLTDAEFNPLDARRKALDAWRTSPTRQARGALLSNATVDFPVTLSSGLKQAHSIDVSPDGKLVAVGGEGGRITVTDVRTGKRLGADFAGHNHVAVEVAFSPDGSMLATLGRGERDGIRVWDMPSGRLLTTVPARGFLAWRPDNGALAALAFPDEADRTTRMVGAWDPRTGELQGWLAGPYVNATHPPEDGAFNPAGDRLALGRANGVVELWIPGAPEPVLRDTAHRDNRTGENTRLRPTAQVAFSAGLLASASPADGMIRFADPLTGTPAGTPIPVDTTFGDLTFTPDGGHVLTVNDATAGVARWNVPRGQLDGYLAGPPESGEAGGQVVSVATGPSGDTVAVKARGQIMVWHRNANRTFVPTGTTAAVAASPDGDTVTAAADDGVYTWRPTAGPAKREGTAATFALGYLPDGGRVAGTTDGGITVTGADGTTRTAPLGLDRVRAARLAVAPNGKQFAVGATGFGPDGKEHTTMSVWDAATLAPRTTVDLGTDAESGLTFTADSATLLLTATAVPDPNSPIQTVTTVRRWRMTDFHELDPFRVDAPGVVAVTPDGKSLILAKRNQLQVRDIATGAPRRDDFGKLPAAVSSLAVSPDGRLLAVGMRNDASVRLWDLTTYGHIATLTGHAGGTTGLAFAPDSRFLYSTGGDDDVVRWPLDPAAAARQICADLTAAGETGLDELGCDR